ncbi:hypothetical protein [Microbacterium sp. HJ5]
MWEERIVDGVPLITVGVEFYDYVAKTGNAPFAEFTAAQLDWLESRLDYWSAQDKPVLLFSHHLFANSVSGSYTTFYKNDFGASRDAFEQLLLKHPNVITFVSHTHWRLDLQDWAVNYRGSAANAASVRGIPMVNTGALANVYGPSGDYSETNITSASATGLRVKVYGNQVVVESWDFLTETRISQVAFPVPQG